MTIRPLLAIEPLTAESFAPFGWVAESSGNAGRPSRDDAVAVRVRRPHHHPHHLAALRRAVVLQAGAPLRSHPDLLPALRQPFGGVRRSAHGPRRSGRGSAPGDVRAFLVDPGRGFSFARGTWHSLDRYVLAPPGATFVILNVDPNPTQIVDYADGTSERFADLDVDPEPIRHLGRHRTAAPVRGLIRASRATPHARGTPGPGVRGRLTRHTTGMSAEPVDPPRDEGKRQHRGPSCHSREACPREGGEREFMGLDRRRTRARETHAHAGSVRLPGVPQENLAGRGATTGNRTPHQP